MAFASSSLPLEPWIGSPLLRWDGRLTLVVAAALLPIVLTYALTSLRAYWAQNVRRGGDTPAVPYAVPLVGNTVQFAYDTEGFLTKTLRRFNGVPFRLKVGLENMYYIPYGEMAHAMFKKARELSMKPIIIVAMRDQFGMFPQDLAIFERDGSGDCAKPLKGWENTNPAHRVLFNQHRDLNAMLNGVHLEGLISRFTVYYTARLRTTAQVGDEWTELPDLFAFLRDHMFHAACTALLGERFLELCPDFARDFWVFDSHSLTYLRRTPRWMASKAYSARDRVLASMKKWHKHARTHVDYKDPALADLEYEPTWGARLMRVRAEMFDNAGFSPDGCATMDLGFVWAASANVIPATIWVLLNTLLSKNLEERVTSEMADCFDEAKNAFELSALYGKPLLNAVYLEALRHCVATTSARNPVIDNFKLRGWNMPRDSLMLSISWFGAHDPHFWNTGRVLASGQAEHPVSTYWAERFLEYPDDPTTGPVRKPNGTITQPGKKRERTPADDRTAKAVSHSAALQGHFYPYGGGSRICPGRHLAKQEMLIAVAVMMKEFEMELMDPVGAAGAKPDARVFPTGAMVPDRKVRVRIRRRR
ncbi:hypothetical protein N0V88_006045 [Collariella sp. IMI 366227]|nr:hypothetical protein N0V88_006045 [Collariella sp. IMI 366227]